MKKVLFASVFALLFSCSDSDPYGIPLPQAPDEPEKPHIDPRKIPEIVSGHISQFLREHYYATNIGGNLWIDRWSSEWENSSDTTYSIYFYCSMVASDRFLDYDVKNLVDSNYLQLNSFSSYPWGRMSLKEHACQRIVYKVVVSGFSGEPRYDFIYNTK